MNSPGSRPLHGPILHVGGVIGYQGALVLEIGCHRLIQWRNGQGHPFPLSLVLG